MRLMDYDLRNISVFSNWSVFGWDRLLIKFKE